MTGPEQPSQQRHAIHQQHTASTEVAQAEGLSASVLSIETIRQALLRLKVGWKRAKRWLTSPDPAYAQKNAVATG